VREVTYKRVETIDEFIDAICVQVNVFIIAECPTGWEPSELDKSAEHYIAIRGVKIIAAGRLREDTPGLKKIESMAVKRDYCWPGTNEVCCAGRRKPAS
jgi:hypothetical protein